MRDFNSFNRDADRMMAARQRQFRRFRNLIILFQVLMVIGVVWLLVHPEAIGSWFHRLITAAGA